MRAVICCPGPSLANYQPTPADLVIAVNRAATKVECGTWLCCDPPLIQQAHEQVIGSPLLVTSTDGHHVCSTFERDFGKKLWRGEFVCQTEALGYCPHAYQWVMFSATSALVWAGFKGADVIDCYGADWAAGEPDFDGVQAGKNRSADRFKLEREIWENLTAWMGERSVKVQRH